MRLLPAGPTLPALACLALLACGDSPLGPSASDFADEPAPIPHPAAVAFVGVHVVPMTDQAVLEDHTVVVRGSVIEAIGPRAGTTVPPDAFVVEGRGRYLMPGLADMHVHLTSGSFANLRNDFQLWLANGVTTLRVMWGSTGILAERDRIASGEVEGPTLLVASPGIDGPGGTWEASTPTVATAEEARARVEAHAGAGYDFIKVYNELDRAQYAAITVEAGAQAIPVVGHVPSRVGMQSVQDARQMTVEHSLGLKYAASDPFTGGTLDEPRVAELVGRSAVLGVAHTPTISVMALSESRASAIRAGPEVRRVSPAMRDFFVTGFHHGLPDDVADREARNGRDMIRAIHDGGARLLVGTDAGFGWILPGYSIHDELASFVAAGLSPRAALTAATSGAARAMRREGEFGRITVGARADLVLLARNPLDDVGALRESSGTMVRGRWLSRGTLSDRLDAIEASYAAGAGAVPSAPRSFGEAAPPPH